MIQAANQIPLMVWDELDTVVWAEQYPSNRVDGAGGGSCDRWEVIDLFADGKSSRRSSIDADSVW